MAPIRTWSFTKFWAVTAVTWAITGAAGAVADYFDSFGLVVLGLAFIPAFLAGAWAGEHPEIQYWPRVRVIAMWALAIAGLTAVSDGLHEWKLAALIVGAPVSILTIRWYELGGTTPPAPILPPAVTAEQTAAAPPDTTQSVST